MMLDKTTSFFSFSTNRFEETRQFYENILGFEVEVRRDRFLHVHLPSGEPLVIYDKADHVAATYTVLNFQVQNIAQLVDALIDRGVIFEQYGPPIQTDVKGISWDDEGSHIAWFRDPGGNILALIEH
ncbi:MAG: VOC family protein [Bacteroidota bacterium]